MYSKVFIIYELSSARQCPCSTAKLAELHDRSTTWFQTPRYCRPKVEFNSINLIRHGSSTTFDTGLIELANRGSGLSTDAFLKSVKKFLHKELKY